MVPFCAGSKAAHSLAPTTKTRISFRAMERRGKGRWKAVDRNFVMGNGEERRGRRRSIMRA
jgi:hypothetical protein